MKIQNVLILHIPLYTKEGRTKLEESLSTITLFENEMK